MNISFWHSQGDCAGENSAFGYFLHLSRWGRKIFDKVDLVIPVGSSAEIVGASCVGKPAAVAVTTNMSTGFLRLDISCR